MQILLCVAVFILNGFVSVTLKHHQIETNFKAISSNDFVVLGNIVKVILAGGLFFILKNKTAEFTGFKSLKTVYLISAGIALIGGISSILQLGAAITLPATVLYPFITGGNIIFTSLASKFVFKERFTPRLWAGVILCFLSTLLFL